jgi:hypothetical protein
LQIETSKSRGGRRYLPYAFTQEGIAVLSSVLRSPRAVAVNIEIMRALIRMRGMLLSKRNSGGNRLANVIKRRILVAGRLAH